MASKRRLRDDRVLPGGGRTARRGAAGLVLAFAPAPSYAAPQALPELTAEQVLAASRAVTSIGPDPCKISAADEIVVCARITSPYALPLYTSEAAPDEGPGSTMIGLAAAREAFASCHARGDECLAPLPVLRVGFGKGKKSGVRIGKD